jgi:PAS domain S-box-containing protein
MCPRYYLTAGKEAGKIEDVGRDLVTIRRWLVANHWIQADVQPGVIQTPVELRCVGDAFFMIKRFKPNDALANRNGPMTASVDLLALLDLAPVLGRDLQDRILHWGHGAQSLYGFTAEEALGRISHRLLNTVFPRPIEELRASLLARGRWDGELTNTRKDGGRVVVTSQWVLQCGPDGQPCAILELDRDITERKNAEREQATLAAVVANSPDAIIGEDLDGIITSWNPGAE